MKLKLLAAALVLGTTGAATGSTQEARPVVQAERITTRFVPPVGTVQRFRVRVTKRGQTQSWVEELRFERSGAGYLAHWRMDPASFSAEMRHPLLAPSLRPFTGTPVTLELDDEGEPVRLRDWAPLKARILESTEALVPLMMTAGAGQPKPTPADSRRVLEGVNALYGQLSPETAPKVVVKYLSQALGWGGYDMEAGETVEGVEQSDVPLFGTSVERRIKITLADAQPDVARFVIVAQIDGAAMKDMMSKVAAMFENPDPAVRERARRSMAQLEQMTVVQTATVLLDRATGLPRRFEQSVSADGKTGDAFSIEWLRAPQVS
jgi:hypothetical protein